MVYVSQGDGWKLEQSQGPSSELWDLNKGRGRSLAGGDLQWLRGGVPPTNQEDQRGLHGGVSVSSLTVKYL